jgi:APA family basic amino acid/polyamine antiporter
MTSHPTAETMSAPEQTTRLARKLGLGDAIGIGLGAMLGAGAFAAPGPAAALAGSGIVLALVLAGLVAYANATSTARLSAVQPQAGGVYAFGRKRLNDTAGFTAGWAFVAGKLASLTAMALTFGAYAFPHHAKLAGVGAVVVLTIVNLSGVQRTAKAATLGGVIVGLGLLMVGLGEIAAPGDGSGRGASFSHLTPLTGNGGLHEILGAAGIMFFAFAGYARIATLGEEVKDPERTIPKAVPLALGAAFLIYLVSLIGALVAVGPEALANSAAPLETAARSVIGNNTADAVQLIAVIAVLGVLLSLLAGVSRTAFAMADDGELPTFLNAVSERTKVPHVAQIATGTIVVVAVLLVPTAKAITTSSLLILTYYAIAHLSALRLSEADKRPKILAPLGLIGCAALALNLPWRDVVTGIAILAVGLAGRAVVRGLRSA